MAKFQLKKFDQLTNRELYDALALRTKVFVMEQNSIYLDADGRDLEADHILLNVHGKLAGYARLYNENGVVKIGRVVVDPEFRGTGLGKDIMNEALRILRERKTKEDIIIHAQHRLLRFYRELGFSEYGEIFLEDGIDHIYMKYVG